MDIKQLQYFVAIANENQITKAATKLYMTQPSLSRQLKNLEDEIGCRLIRRTNKKLELTEEGQEFLLKAQDILTRVENLKYLSNQDPSQITGTLRIGTLISCTSILASYLQRFRLTFPSVSVKIWENQPYVLISMLKKQELDVAFLRTPTFNPEDLCTHILARNAFYLVISKQNDPFPQKDQILIEDLIHIPLVMLHKGKLIGYNELIEAELVQHGIHPRISCQCSNSSVAINLVERGLGGTILPFTEEDLAMDTNLSYKKIINMSSHSDPTIVWNDNALLSFQAQKFLEILGAGLDE